MPKFLGWFERILTANPAGADHLVGRSVTYGDLSLLQLVGGLRFTFPLAIERELAKLLRVTALHKAVAEPPRLRAYLASERRVPFKETGIFRHLPPTIRCWTVSTKVSAANLMIRHRFHVREWVRSVGDICPIGVSSEKKERYRVLCSLSIVLKGYGSLVHGRSKTSTGPPGGAKPPTARAATADDFGGQAAAPGMRD